MSKKITERSAFALISLGLLVAVLGVLSSYFPFIKDHIGGVFPQIPDFIWLFFDLIILGLFVLLSWWVFIRLLAFFSCPLSFKIIEEQLGYISEMDCSQKDKHLNRIYDKLMDIING